MLKEHTSPVDFAAQWMASGFSPVLHTIHGKEVFVEFIDPSDGSTHRIVTPNYEANKAVD